MRLTFEHFCDRPTWAAAAGYEFNIIDCLSASACSIDIFKGIKELVRNIPDIELRSVLWELPLTIIAIPVAMMWPLAFWIVGIASYVKCRRSRRKYLNSDNETVQANLRNWRQDCDRRIRYAKRH